MTEHSVKLTPCKKPDDATHIEQDGTFWKNEKGNWYHWNKHFKKMVWLRRQCQQRLSK